MAKLVLFQIPIRPLGWVEFSSIQLKCCCSNHGQNAVWSSMPQNMLVKLSSLTMWSIFSGLEEEFWKSWATPLGLIDGGKRGLLVGWVERGGLSNSIAGVLDISSFTSELFSLLLQQEPSVSLLRLIDSVGSLLLSDNIYIHIQIDEFNINYI